MCCSAARSLSPQIFLVIYINIVGCVIIAGALMQAILFPIHPFPGWRIFFSFFGSLLLRLCFCSPWLRPNGWVSFRPFCVVWRLRVLIFVCRIYLNSWPKWSPREIPFFVPSSSSPCPCLFGTYQKSVFCDLFVLFIFIWTPPLL